MAPTMPPRYAQPRPPRPGTPGYSRDTELEGDRGTGRPAAADLDGSAAKANRQPILGPGLDPDLNPGLTGT